MFLRLLRIRLRRGLRLVAVRPSLTRRVTRCLREGAKLRRDLSCREKEIVKAAGPNAALVRLQLSGPMIPSAGMRSHPAYTEEPRG